MKYSAAIAHVRQLCSLGLGGQVIMPALLQALHWIVPSHSNVFTWTDKSGAMTNVCFEELVTPEMVALCLAALYNQHEDVVSAEPSQGTRALREGSEPSSESMGAVRVPRLPAATGRKISEPIDRHHR